MITPIKKLHQIWITDNNVPPSQYVSAQMSKLKEMYNDYEYTLYDNDTCRNIIESEFGKGAVKLYDTLTPYAFKADLARYCILYKHGGQYFDAALCPEFKLNVMFDALVYKSPDEFTNKFHAIENGVMIFNVTHHNFLLDAIECSLKNIKRQDYGVHALSITGPIMLGSLNLSKKYNLVTGHSKKISSTQKASFFGEEMHWLHRDIGTYLHNSKYECIGVNDYRYLYNSRQVFTNNKNINKNIKYVSKDDFNISVAQRWWSRDRGDETLRLEYPLNEESVVFDLGGYQGDFAFEINKKYGCHVFVYEPVKKFYEQCILRFDNNPKIKCFNYGLFNESGKAFISDEDNGSSIIKNNTSNNEQIILKQFKEEYDRLGIKKINLLKINVEGSEFLIIPHLIEQNLIKNINDLQVQFHTFFPNAEELRNEIRSNLKKTHIEQWNYPFIWESWRLR